mmetsp:Transcript_60900/g.170293  ORF Transcript_60900/g.170293 Transcript_60900/m.170293 type:complete len:663 (-) Transcript_60900:75-2063(-)
MKASKPRLFQFCGLVMASAVLRQLLRVGVRHDTVRNGRPWQPTGRRIRATGGIAFAARSTARGITSRRGHVPPPIAEFQSTYSLIRELRSDRRAVVDRQGTQALHDRATQGSATKPPPDPAYMTLVSLMLSAQTKDEVTAEAVAKLRAHGLTVPNVLATPEADLKELIKRVGFHNRKARHILATTRILQEEHGGNVPQTLDELLQLPGVGPKMAILLLQIVYGKVVGISVDTHVHRIANSLGWVETARPEQTRRALEQWVPREYWGSLNPLLVGLGQEAQTRKEQLRLKASTCSRPGEAAALLQKLGLETASEPVVPASPTGPAMVGLRVRRTPTPRRRPLSAGRNLRILALNVNSLRALLAKPALSGALKEVVAREAPDIFCMSEHKLKEEDVTLHAARLQELLPTFTEVHFTCSTTHKGYAGVALLVRRDGALAGQTPIDVREGFGHVQTGDTIVDKEGRVLTLELPELFVVTVYVPNSGTALKRLGYRVDRAAEHCWDRSFGDYLQRLQATKPVIVIGDLNCAHTVRDIHNMYACTGFPDGLEALPLDEQYKGLSAVRKQAGLTPEERESFSMLLEHTGMVDTFRALHPDASGVFSYFSQRVPRNRQLNRGLRLDYVLASQSLCQAGRSTGPYVHDSFVLDQDAPLSDHVTIGCDVTLP